MFSHQLRGQREEENVLGLLEESFFCWILLGTNVKGMVFQASQLVVVPALLISAPCCAECVKHTPNAAVIKCLAGIANPLGLDR